MQVVSKGLRWDQQMADKAAASHQYIKIGQKPGHLLLSGAPGRWKKADTAMDIYIPALRIAGNPAVIRQAFGGTPEALNNINQYLNQGYTAANYRTTMKQAFDAEVARYKGWKQQRDAIKKATGGPSVNLSQLSYFVEQLQVASTVARTTGSPRATAAATGSPGRSSRVRALADKLADASAKNKVLDVSNVDLVKGTRIRTIVRPGPQAKKKLGVPGLDIVSSDPARYAHVVRQLGPQYEPYIERYNALVAQKNAVVLPPGGQGLAPAPAPMFPAPAPMFQAPAPAFQAPAPAFQTYGQVPRTYTAPSVPGVAPGSPLQGGLNLPGQRASSPYGTLPLVNAPGLPTNRQTIGSPLGSPSSPFRG